MNRTIYYRNLIVFFLFVAVIFVTPYVFAQQVTSPTLLRVDNVSTQLLNRDNPNQLNTTLEEGSIIRLPNPIVENMVYDENGGIAMAETLRVWHTLAAGDPRLMPRMVNGRLVYPVQVLQATDETFDSQSRDSVGYIALSDFLRPHSFNTVRADEDLLMNQPVQADREPILGGPEETTQSGGPAPVTSPDDFPFLSGEDDTTGPVSGPLSGGETTAPTTSLRPQLRPDRPAEPPAIPSNIANAPSLDRQFNCNNSWSGNYSRTNCFAQNGMTLTEKAEHIMGDIHALNSMRELTIDPRFSVCVAYRESRFAPNADSGRGDWGLYQIRDTTGEEAIANHGMVTPGFENFDRASEYRSLRSEMVDSPLAQADIHHSVVVGKAAIADFLRGTNIRQRLGNGTMRVEDYQILADYYNASSHRRQYARAVANCYRAMLSVATEDGQIRSGQASALAGALNLATQ